MKIPDKLIEAFASLDEGNYLTFAIFTEHFFPMWPGEKVEVCEAFTLIHQVGNKIELFTKEGETEFEAGEAERFHRGDLHQAIALLRKEIPLAIEAGAISREKFEDEDTPESVQEQIFAFFDEFESSFCVVDSIDIPQFQRHWLGSEFNGNASDDAPIKITAEALDFEYHSVRDQDGICAEFDDEGNLVFLAKYEKAGKTREVLEIDFPGQTAVVTARNEFLTPEYEQTESEPTSSRAVLFYEWLQEQIGNLSYVFEEADMIVCNFCGSSQDQVRKIIAGPSVCICNNCIELCNDILAEAVDE